MMPEPSTSQTQGAASSPEHLAVNLQVVSPSVGVNRPLLFPDLPATTTIKKLKEIIRQTLPLRPADENQRLIHQGRALLRESDSLLDVFGAEALRTPDRQTIHLVIRDAADGQTSVPSTAVQGPVDGTSAPRSSHSPHPPSGPDPPPGFPRRTHFQTTTHHVAQPRMPSPAPAPHLYHHHQHHQHHQHQSHQPHQHHHHPPEQAMAFQQHHQNMTNLLGQIQRDAHLQREAMVRALVNQNQRGRAQLGMRGIGDAAGNHVGNGSEPNNGRASPNTSHSVHYETFGPNGHAYHVDTIVRTTTQGPLTVLSPAEVQNIIRGADANQSTMAMTNAMQRSGSEPSLHNRPLTQPGVTASVFATGGSLAGGSGLATPDLDLRSTGATASPTVSAAPMPSSTSAISNSSPSQPQQGPQVYILSSPEGPRALLFNPSATETYYTPRLRIQAGLPLLGSTASSSNLAFAAQSQYSYTAPQQGQRQHPQDEPAGPAHAQAPAQPVHPHNPPAAGLPPLLMQLWPHIWLIFRLGLFVWFFTSPSSSWSRWLTIICLAVFMFVLSTGLLNGVAENAWRPMGRHLENLLPALERPRNGQGVDPGRGQGAQPGGQEGGAAPEQLAARLIAQRRPRAGWLAGQFRRLERAGLLFLASLAPGVAERHIANLEAEARAEDSRRREVEAAAANITSGEGDANSGDRNEDEGNSGDNEDGGQEEQRGGQGQGHEEAPEARLGGREEALVAV